MEVIWPLSSVACRSGAALGSKGVLPLRTFIQETLRRSRTSYSTLQVALYYLIIIKPHVPNRDFTQEQPHDGPAALSLQCGRRMFLAALILASKYLQDRNYSARAWSKISGLSTQEVNTNEMAFLGAVNWKLHISESIFQRWTDIVLQITSPAPPLPPPCATRSTICVKESKVGWISIIPRLTPQLDTIEIGSINPLNVIPPLSPDPYADIYRPAKLAGTNPTVIHHDERPPTPPYDLPGGPESQTYTLNPTGKPIVPLTMVRDLPTPLMTPPSSGDNTPAVSVESISSRRSSIGRALAHADRSCTARTTLDGPSSAASMAGALLMKDFQRRADNEVNTVSDRMMIVEEESNSDDEMVSMSVDGIKEGSLDGGRERAIRCRRRRTRQTSDRRRCHPSHPPSTQSRGLGRELSVEYQARASPARLRQQHRSVSSEAVMAMG